MKKLFLLSTSVLLFMGVSSVSAQTYNDLTPSEIFCSNTSARSGNAINEVRSLISSRFSGLSNEEKQILTEMIEQLDDSDTVQSVCSPAEF